MLLEAISLAALLSRRPAAEPVVTCHRGTVSYRFEGTPGTTIRYMGRTYSVPPKGFIELIGHGGDRQYDFDGRGLPLEMWPIDEFGTRTVPLPDAPPP
jgi:hypothetical protein